MGTPGRGSQGRSVSPPSRVQKPPVGDCGNPEEWAADSHASFLMSRVLSQTQFRDSKARRWAGPAAVFSARSGAGRLLTVKPQLASGRRGAAQPTSGVPGGRGLGLRLASEKV